MRNKDTKEVTTIQETTISITCDCCGKVSNGKYLPPKWHEFTSRHHEWGGDSIDSVKGYHVCSPTCYVNHFAKVVSEISRYESAEIDEMELDFAKLLVEHFDKPKG